MAVVSGSVNLNLLASAPLSVKVTMSPPAEAVYSATFKASPIAFSATSAFIRFFSEPVVISSIPNFGLSSTFWSAMVTVATGAETSPAESVAVTVTTQLFLTVQLSSSSAPPADPWLSLTLVVIWPVFLSISNLAISPLPPSAPARV